MNSNPSERSPDKFRKELLDLVSRWLNLPPNLSGSPSMSLGEYTGKEVPLVPGSLRVYRNWLITPDGYLTALHWPQIWSKAEGNEAHCAKWFGPKHHSPQMNCTCGFYGKYLPEDTGPGYMHGVAEFSGRIILGTKGARAQYAKPVALNLNRIPAGFRPLFQSNYPDLKLFPNNHDMYKEFPPQDVSELIPKPEPERIVIRNMTGKIVIDISTLL